uniref:C2H2-type domain-containing protein n=1 Tax=Macrostomum lignano TaxID=282301 RepID=A0A1I8FPZ9_9PLAT
DGAAAANRQRRQSLSPGQGCRPGQVGRARAVPRAACDLRRATRKPEQSDEADGADSDARSDLAELQLGTNSTKSVGGFGRNGNAETTSGRRGLVNHGRTARLKEIRRRAARAADVKEEPPELGRQSSRARRASCWSKITACSRWPQSAAGLPSQQKQPASSPQAACQTVSAATAGKVLSCRTTLLRHIRSMHRANYICMRCRRGFNRRQHAYSHITKVHRLLSRSEIESLLRYAQLPPGQTVVRARRLRCHFLRVASRPAPVALLDTDESVAEAAAHCLRPGQLPDKSMPPAAATTTSANHKATAAAAAHPSAAVSCDLDASTVSEEDALMSERHQCDLCQLSFVSAEFLASHRRLCDSFRLEEVRVLSAWSLADATAAAEAAAAGPAQTPGARSLLCRGVARRLQRHVRDAAAAEAPALSLELAVDCTAGRRCDVLVHLNRADRSLLGRRCPECRLWLIGDAAMAEHEAAAHSEPTMFGCQVCRTFCPNRVALVAHYRWVHLLDGAKATCLMTIRFRP